MAEAEPVLGGLYFSFVVKGRPISSQNTGPAKRDWQKKISDVAKLLFLSPLADSDLVLRVTVFHNRIPEFDIDNVSKPISDALGGVVYHDDRQLTDRYARRRSLDGAYRIKGVRPQLATAMAEGEEFVYIEIYKLGDKVENLL